MQTANRDPDPFRHGTVDSVTESQSSRTKVVLARSTVGTKAADPCRCLGGDAVALAKTVNRSAHLRNYTAELVPQNHRDVDGPALRVVVLVNLTSAYPNGGAS